MAKEQRIRKKRRSVEFENDNRKKSKNSSDNTSTRKYIVGKITKIAMQNFMCHDAMQVTLNQNVNFIVGRNGSGKSAILTALTIGLGARANVTNRGVSVKDFIKKGKSVAVIEITLINKGCMAYKHDIYGDWITIIRSIGKRSGYKIKNWQGEVISTKRDELESILYAMNIQIDNPISILNQDVSKTFLVSSKSEEKYELFMKATRLDVIGNNYREAIISSEEANKKLEQANEVLHKTKEELDDLKERIQLLNEVDGLRNKLEDLHMELQWAIAISEEAKLQHYKENLQKCKQKLQELKKTAGSMETKDAEITEKITQLQSEVQQAEQKVLDSSNKFKDAKNKCIVEKETYSAKIKELRIAQIKTKHLADDINLLRKEIQRLECGDDKQDERNKIKQCLGELQHKLDEVEAMLRTKKTDSMHLETNRVRRSQEIQSKKIEIDSNEVRIRKLKRELQVLKQQSDNALIVFGPNIPRLLKRIEEEYKKGRFKQRPRGPLGAYVMMKDPEWIPAVENFLGATCFSTFCADNSEDAKVLTKIMEEVFLNERIPQIVYSKFFSKIHDVSQHCTRSSDYFNMLEAMEISDPVVANCLIDQWEIECVLLIRTGQEACEIMSDAKKVPHNCKRAITQQGDMFYPDPNYRTYGARRGIRAKYLQISTTEAIHRLEEELAIVEEERNAGMKLYTNLCEQTERTQRELADVNAKIAKLHSARDKYKTAINDFTDKIKASEAISVTVFHTELTELEKKLQNEKSEEQRLSIEIEQLEKNINNLENEVKHYRELRYDLDLKVNPLNEEIRRLKDEKEMLHLKDQQATRTLKKTEEAVQSAVAEFESQQEITNEAIENASKCCPRMNTERTMNEIKNLHKSLKWKIHEVEQSFGSKKELSKKLKSMKEKYSNVIEFSSVIEENNRNQLRRLKSRKKMYENMKQAIGVKVKNSFSTILALRKYKGSINIDHVHKLLTLQVSPQNDNQNSITDTRSLSGGERSYSTVAFMLALWDCTNLPFYFLDEFDVFMDKVNRRVIMDILLDYTKSHPQCQFTFLTPLDTSNILAEDFVTIHQLAPPERA
ncbi:structural maintenance of chromosomes protein 6 isoform X1 [Vespa crabro]|uniref:structural maintenance of chromosomes protein 6 isoform X1 n=1 Tax=Vespa crabro TaxID=7445 RepID=UPI001EFF9CAC|nr:structural maintenance of chromosomes protein 6 isoform X1 [Vespa crabro]